MINARVTITRRGDTQSAKGYRSKTAPGHVLRDAPCSFAPSTGSRSRYADGMREYVQSSPQLTVDSDEDILKGDQATVTYWAGSREFTETFTVDDAVPSPGIGVWPWLVTLSRIR